MIELRDKGNTVLIIEHDPDAIAIADHIVDMGIGVGKDGGKVIFEGLPIDIIKNNISLTGQYLKRHSNRIK